MTDFLRLAPALTAFLVATFALPASAGRLESPAAKIDEAAYELFAKYPDELIKLLASRHIFSPAETALQDQARKKAYDQAIAAGKTEEQASQMANQARLAVSDEQCLTQLRPMMRAASEIVLQGPASGMFLTIDPVVRGGIFCAFVFFANQAATLELAREPAVYKINAFPRTARE